jgi:phage major head subunit gpT-like protein
MLINASTLADLDATVQITFARGLQRAVTPWEPVAMRIPSGGAETLYPLLTELGDIREWVGDRVVQNVRQDGFRLLNQDWEASWSIDRNAILDDQFGLYAPAFEQGGQSAAAFPSREIFKLLKAGHTKLGPDGQFFFDTDHPLADGTTGDNDIGGGGTPWYLIDDSKVFKPVIYQERQSFALQRLFDPTDANVFFNKKFVWGVDGRAAFGFSPFWQLAIRSEAALDATNVKAAMVQMSKQKTFGGKPVGAMATTIVVPPDLGETARDLFAKDLIVDTSGGPAVTNTLRNRLRVVVAHELL